jgi:hypothetical protein
MYLPDVGANGNMTTTDSKVPTAILSNELRNSQSLAELLAVYQ